MFEHKGIWPLTPVYILSSSIICILRKRQGERKERGRASDSVKTCQLPFTFAEECWQVFTMLSDSTRDKSFKFINKIDGIACHRILLCVFPYKPLCQKHPRYLTTSHPLRPSPGMSRCFNTVPIQNQTTAGYSLRLFLLCCDGESWVESFTNLGQKTDL